MVISLFATEMSIAWNEMTTWQKGGQKVDVGFCLPFPWWLYTVYSPQAPTYWTYGLLSFTPYKLYKNMFAGRIYNK